MLRPKVSVIIPVYNVEKYIEKCAESLFNQSLIELEFIFVDDCSQDRSLLLLTVLDKYPYRKKQVKILVHENNLGVSQSRQDGLDIATGEYIIHCDPDDWVATNMYETMYMQAKKHSADIVFCNVVVESDSKWIRKNKILRML